MTRIALVLVFTYFLSACSAGSISTHNSYHGNVIYDPYYEDYSSNYYAYDLFTNRSPYSYPKHYSTRHHYKNKHKHRIRHRNHQHNKYKNKNRHRNRAENHDRVRHNKAKHHSQIKSHNHVDRNNPKQIKRSNVKRVNKYRSGQSTNRTSSINVRSQSNNRQLGESYSPRFKSKVNGSVRQIRNNVWK